MNESSFFFWYSTVIIQWIIDNAKVSSSVFHYFGAEVGEGKTQRCPMVHCPSSVVVQIWSRVWNLSCPDSKPGLIHSFTNSLLTAILSRAQNGHTIIRKTQYFSWDLVQDLDLDWVWTKLKFFLKIRPDSARTRICNASEQDWNRLESGPSLDEFRDLMKW